MLCLCLALVPVTTVRAAEPESTPFNIPAQPMVGALQAFSARTGIDVVGETQQLKTRTSQPVVGTYAPEKALQLLLQGSGLRIEKIGETTIRVSLPEQRSELKEGAPAMAMPTATQRLRAQEPPPEELIVTGTRIRGVTPVGSALIVLDRQRLEESGRPTIAEILATIPQVQTVGARAEYSTGGQAVGARGTSLNQAGVNLRGLGADATLSLLNGRRLAPSGQGSFVDVSIIPLAALERVEILADGASALYGSDAIAGVVNFVTKRGYSGAESYARFGYADGQRQYTAGQSIGVQWQSGSALLSAEHYTNTTLSASSRSYATMDLRPFGGPDLRATSYAAPGTITASGRTYAIPAGQDGRSLTPGQLIAGTQNLGDYTAASALIPGQERNSAFLTITQEITPKLSVSADGLFSRRDGHAIYAGLPGTFVVPSSNPFFVRFTPTLTSETVAYSFINDVGPITLDTNSKTYQANLGATYKFTDDWQLNATLSQAANKVRGLNSNYANSALLAQALADPNPATAFNPFGAGGNNNPATIDRIRGYNDSTIAYRESTAGATLNGSLFTLPGGDVRIAVGAEARSEVATFSGFSFVSTVTPTQYPGTGSTKRYVNAVFGEIVVPLVQSHMEIPLVDKLSLSAAVRAEHYNDFGSSRNPRLGVAWKPVADLELRSSWGRSFKAPQLYQLQEAPGGLTSYTERELADPASPTGTSKVLSMTGNNASLQPETSTSWTFGGDWQVSQVPGLRLSATWFSIDYKNRILSTPAATILTNQAIYGALILRNPSVDLVNRYASSPLFSVSSLVFPPSQIVAIVDARLQNAGVVTQNGVDVSASYSVSIGAETLSLNGGFTRLTEYKIQQTSKTPKVSFLSVIANPMRTRANLGASFGNPVWQAGMSANYVGAYQNTTVTPNARVSAWATVDSRASYNFNAENFGGPLQIALNVQNLFDRDPPRVANVTGQIGYDPEQATALGRVISIELRKKW